MNAPTTATIFAADPESTIERREDGIKAIRDAKLPRGRSFVHHEGGLVQIQQQWKTEWRPETASTSSRRLEAIEASTQCTGRNCPHRRHVCSWSNGETLHPYDMEFPCSEMRGHLCKGHRLRVEFEITLRSIFERESGASRALTPASIASIKSGTFGGASSFDGRTSRQSFAACL